METLERLDRIDPGHCGIVVDVEAGADEVDQLKSMGVCIGRKVMLVQAGDPLVLKVMGTRLGVSARLAARVFVEPSPRARGRRAVRSSRSP